MIRYEVWYVEILWQDESRVGTNCSDLKVVPFEETDDERAAAVAHQLLKAPSDNPLVDRKVFNKLVRIVDINPPANFTFDDCGVSH
jgi:hypothetical protein